MPLVIHSDQGRESDGMIERFNRTCLMMRSIFVNDRRDNHARLSHERPPVIPHFDLWWVKNVHYHRMFPLPNFELNVKMMWHHTRLLLGFEMLWRSPMTTFGILFGKLQVAGNDCTTPRQSIGSFRWGRGYYDITHRPLNINWVPPGSDPTRS